jgi:hypothetical protein
MLYRLQVIFVTGLCLLFSALLVAGSTPQANNQIDRLRAYTRPVEFDYGGWTVSALFGKIQEGALGMPYYAKRASRKVVVADYLRVTQRILEAEYQLNLIYGDPSISDPEAASAHLRNELAGLYKRQDELALIAEATLQDQVTQVLAEQGLVTGGQTIPPVLYHSSPIPMGLIVSPRNVIEQEANISVSPDLTLEQQVELEDRVAKGMNVSTLVVPIGGIGVYPTMVMRTSDLSWLLDTISHEWTHNYLTLHPLGVNYDASPELRTMNETTASIVGNEIGQLVLEQFYPELVQHSASDLNTVSQSEPLTRPDDTSPPPFDFRAEMHTTRVKADELLAQGKIDEAEAYMESRRQLFWDNGYAIRKLNQAYFAFYGAYADQPGGAAGEDPVGPAVRALRAQSTSLADFVKTIAKMTSFEELQQAIQSPQE